MVQKPKNRFRKKTVFDMSGLSKIDVFADFYGSFEPTKKPYLFLVETTIVKQCNLK